MRRNRSTAAAKIDAVARPIATFFAALPEAGAPRRSSARWGAPERDPHCPRRRLRACRCTGFGEALVGVQPARGYNIDPVTSYHDPDLVPPHAYFAFYA